jgi:hypothetical protein
MNSDWRSAQVPPSTTQFAWISHSAGPMFPDDCLVRCLTEDVDRAPAADSPPAAHDKQATNKVTALNVKKKKKKKKQLHLTTSKSQIKKKLSLAENSSG